MHSMYFGTTTYDRTRRCTHGFAPHCRNLEMVLFGCQSSLCVVVELGEELPSPADIQLAHGRLRSLCLGGGGNAWTRARARTRARKEQQHFSGNVAPAAR